MAATARVSGSAGAETALRMARSLPGTRAREARSRSRAHRHPRRGRSGWTSVLNTLDATACPGSMARRSSCRRRRAPRPLPPPRRRCEGAAAEKEPSPGACLSAASSASAPAPQSCGLTAAVPSERRRRSGPAASGSTPPVGQGAVRSAACRAVRAAMIARCGPSEGRGRGRGSARSGLHCSSGRQARDRARRRRSCRRLPVRTRALPPGGRSGRAASIRNPRNRSR